MPGFDSQAMLRYSLGTDFGGTDFTGKAGRVLMMYMIPGSVASYAAPSRLRIGSLREPRPTLSTYAVPRGYLSM